MLDLYGSNKKLAGTFKGTAATLTISDKETALVGALVQSLNLNYQKSVSRVMEIGSENQYYVSGQSQGQGDFGAIVGPNNIVISITKSLADECKAASRIVAFSTTTNQCINESDSGSRLQAQASGALLTNVGVSVSADNFLVQQSGSFMFTAMSLSSGTEL